MQPIGGGHWGWDSEWDIKRLHCFLRLFNRYQSDSTAIYSCASLMTFYPFFWRGDLLAKTGEIPGMWSVPVFSRLSGKPLKMKQGPLILALANL